VNPRIAVALLLVGAFALGGAGLAASGRKSSDDDGAASAASGFQGARMPEGLRAPDFALRDEAGKPVSMAALRGRPVLVTFLYTTCEDTCPAQAQTVKGALNELGHDVPAVAIAVDPPRDTPARARAFLGKQRMLGRLRFVLGSRRELGPLWKGFAIQPQTTVQEHQARFTLVDADGFQRVGFPGGRATPEALAHDLRLLEKESQG